MEFVAVTMLKMSDGALSVCVAGYIASSSRMHTCIMDNNKSVVVNSDLPTLTG